MNPFPETEDYRVDVGPTTALKDDTEVYKIINKHTGVVEFETSVLPNVYSTIRQIQDMLDQERKEPESAEIKPFKLDS